MKLYDLIETKVDRGVEVLENIGTDALVFLDSQLLRVETTAAKVEEELRALPDEGTLRDRVSATYDTTISVVHEEFPAIAGFTDGFKSSITGAKTDRSRRNAYMHGAGVGKAAGYISTGVAIVSGGGLVRLAAATPLAIRGLPKARDYVKSKFSQESQN